MKDFNDTIEPSQVNQALMTRKEKLASMRFIFSMPLWEFFHVTSLPTYVYTYIFEVGTLFDLPWVSFIEDDLGDRVARTRNTENIVEIANMCKESTFWKNVKFGDPIHKAFYNKIGVDTFEDAIVRFAANNHHKLNTIF